MSNAVLDARLGSAAELVRQGAVFADVGTDHAHLPIFLLESGRISRAVCSEINSGPLASAARNVEEHGLSDRVELVLTDGAAELSGRGITDYAVCGMGGELIASIVESAPQLAERGIRLILQPMTKQELLRAALYRMGYEIISESYSSAEGKYYVTLLAEYRAEARNLTPTEAYLGISPTLGARADYLGYLEGKLRAITAAVLGKERGGIDASEDEAIRAALARKIAESARE